jgi:hypothetical protein
VTRLTLSVESTMRSGAVKSSSGLREAYVVFNFSAALCMAGASE